MKAFYIFLIAFVFPVALTIGQADYPSEYGEPLPAPGNNEYAISRLPSETGLLSPESGRPALRVGPGDGEDTPLPLEEAPIRDSTLSIALLVSVYALAVGLRYRRKMKVK